MDNSAIRIEIGLRAGMIAKAALEMIGLEPQFCRLQLREVIKLIQETDAKLAKEKVNP